MKQGKNVSLSKIKWKLFLLGLFKIPMINFIRPKIEVINEEDVKVSIRLKRRTKNHLNSMYFGALAIGADVASGIHVFYFAELLDKKVSFAFKSMDAQFLKRADSKTLFVCDEGQKIKNMILTSEKEARRVNDFVKVFALNTQGEEVAIFDMGVSVRVK